MGPLEGLKQERNENRKKGREMDKEERKKNHPGLLRLSQAGGWVSLLQK